jgi:hypothetical protein
MLKKQLEDHNKKTLEKTFTNFELEFEQFKLIIQVL